ncbi:hypothetical protein GMD66_08860 [Parabacteroides merdae]|uniref:Uncharacterized protein n=2 Tax=Parabacteroides merdae TaxID=46503 RepID=A0A7K1HDP4_9BACT|nr:hypothetical protein [Parabacteroides merdae]
MMRGRKRTDLINQIFIGPVLMRSRVKRGNRIVSTRYHHNYFFSRFSSNRI